MPILNSNKRPTSIEEYKHWMFSNENFKFHDDKAQNNYYEAITQKMKQSFESSDFWKKFLKQIQSIEEEYRRTTGYGLLKQGFHPELFIKPYKSFIDKSFRKNIINNSDWPNPPNGEWITCINAAKWFSDLIRTNVIVQYLDGIDFVVHEIQSLASCKVDYQANIQGYYAVHIDVASKFELPSDTWKTNRWNGNVEIQITTEIKELIKELLHHAYERQRNCSSNDCRQGGWQWDYKSDEFKLNYLGHVIHNLEASILEIRDKEIQK